MKKLLYELKNEKYSIKLLDEAGLECISYASASKIALFVLNGFNADSTIRKILSLCSELRIVNIEKKEAEIIKGSIEK